MIANYSHPIILSQDNVLSWRRKFFPSPVEDRLTSPSEICALEFEGEFRRIKISLVSATIGIDRPIFHVSCDDGLGRLDREKTTPGAYSVTGTRAALRSAINRQQ